MNQNEIQNEIDHCEYQIINSYGNLKTAAKNVGTMAYKAAKQEQETAISESSGEKSKKMARALAIAGIGFLMVFAQEFGIYPVAYIGAGMFWVGVILALITHKKEKKVVVETQTLYNNRVKDVENKLNNLNSVLEKNPQI